MQIQLVDGIEFIGKNIDAGHTHNSYLIRTKDNQYIEVTELLYFVAAGLQESSNPEEIARYVTYHYKKQIDPAAVHFLITTKLKPLGIINNIEESNGQSAANSPNAQGVNLISLKFKFTLLSENLTAKIAKLFSPLFAAPIIFFVLLDFILLNIWLFSYHGVTNSFQQTFDQPFLFLLLIALLLFSTLFHEFGHAAGCSQGGAKPGRIGAGLYFIWPAFFTDITDIYRLNRKNKLKSDFGGIYFNCIYALAIAITYFVTGFEPLLLVIALQNISILNQLLPFIRLDGYYIVSDIVGLPDLFMRIKPILANVFLRKPHPAAHVKTWVKLVVTVWIFITIPAMAFLVIFMLINSPQIIYMAWTAISTQIASTSQSFSSGNYVIFAIQLLQLAVVALPAMGIGILFFSLGQQIIALNEKLKYREPEQMTANTVHAS